MWKIKNIFEGRKMADHDTIVGATVTATPGVVYTVLKHVFELPIEKWVSLATLVLVVIQILVILRREYKKQRAHHVDH